jgi:hypothetical protein
MPQGSPHLKLVAAVLVVAAALIGAAARPAPAAAATPCWKALLNDWYDGRIDATYPVHCYSDALKHLPADVQTYSSAHDDILRALQSAKARLKKNGQTAGPNTPIVPTKSGGPGSTTTTSTDTTTSPTTTSPGRSQGKGLTGLADKLNPSSASSLPLPLLVLGALAILLVAAGGAGLLAKRWQARKPAP